ncbi:MAG: linear amide C-N hydrolase [Candidatus Zixiibacteriota bacterium]|nr:MAG: linear amide C-N hydrolase [candidate division Zixibacteria bacterium]
MKKACNQLRFLPAAALLVALVSGMAYPCSTFMLKDETELLFGWNLDFHSSKGLIVINKRNIAKTAMLAPPETPISWVSRYGSVTFNQIGKEFPYGGMNEKGLVASLLWLGETAYPEPDERPSMLELQWIQYQLDNSATVEDVIGSNSELRISSTQSLSTQHFFVCDKQGKAAAIEFIGGEMVCHTGEDLPVTGLTNSPYDESLEFHRAFDTLTLEDKIVRTSLDSRERFAKIGRWTKAFQTEGIVPAVGFAFDILGAVSAGKNDRHCTAWSIVYDVANLRIHYKTYENRAVRTISMENFDFSCMTPTLALDIARDLNGDVSSEFVEYTQAMNAELVTAVMAIYNETFLLGEVSDEAVQYLIFYPQTVRCQEGIDAEPAALSR